MMYDLSWAAEMLWYLFGLTKHARPQILKGPSKTRYDARIRTAGGSVFKKLTLANGQVMACRVVQPQGIPETK